MQVRRPLRATLALALLLVVSGCSLAAPDAGKPVTRDVEIAAVTAVVLTTPGELVVAVGATPSLTVTAGAKVIDRLSSRVDEGVLRLDGSGSGPLAGAIRYELTLPVLDAVTIEGSGEVRADFAGGQAIAVTVKGSGEVIGANLAATTVDAVIEGSGRIELAGTTADQTVDIRGSGDYSALDLSSTRASVDSAGSGDAELTVTERLTASIAGSGDIRHAGGATVDGTIAGSGDISAL